MPDFYALSERDVELLRRVVQEELRRVKVRHGPELPERPLQDIRLWGRVTTEITAADLFGTGSPAYEPGKGECQLYYNHAYFSQASLTVPAYYEMLTAQSTETSYVFQMGEIPLPVGMWVYLIEDSYGCLWATPVPYKPIIIFKLTGGAMTTATHTQTAQIGGQYGWGMDNPNTDADEITVMNTRTSAGASIYLFEGDNGDYGIAAWQYGNYYLIINMECP